MILTSASFRKIKDRSVSDHWLTAFQCKPAAVPRNFVVLKHEKDKELPYIVSFYCLVYDSYYLGAYFDSPIRAFQYYQESRESYKQNTAALPINNLSCSSYRFTRKGWDWNYDDNNIKLTLCESGLLNMLRIQGSRLCGLNLKQITEYLPESERSSLLVPLHALLQKRLINLDFDLEN